METALTVAGGAVGLALGIMGGFKIGALVRGRSGWYYWTLNIAAMVIGVMITTVGLVYAWGWLSIGGMALIAGSLTGLKYGYGKSVGLWRVHDTWMRTDENMRD